MTNPENKNNDPFLLQLANEWIRQATSAMEHQAHRTAELFLQDALEVKESILGATHSEVRQLYLGVAGTLESQGKYQESRQRFHQAIQNYQQVSRQASGMTHAWIGLGTALMNLEKWKEAMEAFQSAAWLELYDRIRPLYIDHPKNKNKQSGKLQLTKDLDSLDSILYLKDFVETIQIKHAKLRLWSHSSFLPKNVDAYLEALQTAVSHEVQGDLYASKGQYALSNREFKIAYTVFRENAYTTIHIGIPSEELWLLRKQILAEWWSKAPTDAMRSFRLDALSYNAPIENAKTICYNHVFTRVCESMLRADEILHTSSTDQPKQRQARNRYRDILRLLDIYQEIGHAEGTEDPEAPNEIVQGVDALQASMVPDGWSQGKLSRSVSPKQVWEDLQRLAIRVEKKGATLKGIHTIELPTLTGPLDSNTPDIIHCGAKDWWWSGVLAMLLVLQFIILPWFVWRRKKMTLVAPTTRRRQTYSQANQVSTKSLQDSSVLLDNKARGASLKIAQDELLAPNSTKSSPRDTFVSKNNDFGTEQTMFTIEALDHFEACLGNEVAMEQDRSSALMAQQVSAKIWVQKTRSLLLTTLIQDIDKTLLGDTDATTLRIHALEDFEDRMRGLGLASSWNQVMHRLAKTTMSTQVEAR